MRLQKFFVTAFGALMFTHCTAENGVTSTEILLGQSAAFTGTTTGQAAIYRDGARLYFDYVNSHGGVHGRTIRVVSYDDAQKPERAIENTQKLIHDDKVFALFNYTWTTTVNAVIPVAEAARVPFFGAYTGTESLYSPHRKYVFTTRASFSDELRQIIKHGGLLHMPRIGLLYYDLPSGTELLNDAQEQIRAGKSGTLTAASMKFNSGDVGAAVATIAAADPQMVIIGASGRDAATFIREMDKAMRRKPVYYARSLVNPALLIKELGRQATGVAVTQTAPNPYKASAPVARQYRALLARRDPAAKPEYIALEGFLSAGIFVEGLRRAGPKPTREGFIKALESIRNYDAGGYRAAFSGSNHNGSRYVEITQIGRDGRMVD